MRRDRSVGGRTADNGANGVIRAEVDVDEEDEDPDDGNGGEDDDGGGGDDGEEEGGGATVFFSKTSTALSILATAVWTVSRLAVRVSEDRLNLSLSASSFSNLVSVALEASSNTETLEAKVLN